MRRRGYVPAVLAMVLLIGQWGCAQQVQKKIAQGSKVYLKYSLEADGVQVVPSSKPEPMELVIGDKAYPPKFEQELLGLQEGSMKAIHLKPEEAFGLVKPELVGKVPRAQLPQGLELKEGMLVGGKGAGGQVAARVAKIFNDFVILDRNHPLAGKSLVYRIQVTRVE